MLNEPSFFMQYFYLLTTYLEIPIILYLAYRTYQWRTASGATPFLCFLGVGLGVVSMFFALSVIHSTTWAWLIVRLRLSGSTLSPLFYFLFVIEIINHRSVSPRIVGALLIIPILTLACIWGLLDKSLFIADWSFERYSIVSTDHMRFGIWGIAYLGYGAFLFIGGSIRLIQFEYRSGRPHRISSFLILTGTLAVVAVAALRGYVTLPLNPSPFAILFLLLACSWIVMNQKLFNLIPFAYETIFQDIRTGFIVLNRANHIIHLNPAAETILRVSRSDVVGKPVTDLLPHDWLSASSLGKTFDTVLPQISPSETYEVTIDPLIYNSSIQEGLLIVLRNITDRKRIENQTQQQNEFLAAFQRITFDLLNRHDRHDLVQTFLHTIKQVLNATDATISLKEGKELITYATTESFSNDQSGRERNTVGLQALDARKPLTSEEFPSMAIFPVLLGQEPLGVLILSRDKSDPFTDEQIQQGTLLAQLAALMLDNLNLYDSALREIEERKRVESALRQSEHRYQQLLENAPVALVVLDIPTLKVHYINPASKLIIPFMTTSPDDQIQQWLEGLLSVDKVKLKQRLSEYTEGITLPPAEYTSIGPHGTELHLVIQSVPIQYDQRPALLVGINNITDTKIALQAEAEQRRFTEALLDIASTVNSTLHLQEVLNRAFLNLRTIIPYDWANIMFIEGNEARVLAEDGYPGLRGIRFLISETPNLRHLMETREPFVIDDTEAYEGWITVPDIPLVRSVLSVPVLRGTEVIGFINLDSGKPHTFTRENANRLKAIATQISIAVLNAQLYERAQEDAATAERQRLARDLHDAVSQTLFSASVTAETLPYLLDADPEFVRQGLEQLTKLTRGAQSEMRTLLVELRPAALQETEFSLLLTHLVNSLKTRTTAEVEYLVEGQSHPIAPDIKIALYRIAQEALNNVIKHSNAHCIRVLLGYNETRHFFRVTDDGLGFDPAKVEPSQLGIRIMRERAAASGIRFTLQSTRNVGTIIEAEWNSPIA